MTSRLELLRSAAKAALRYRATAGVALEGPCDIYDLIARRGLDLQFIDVPSLEGMYLEETETVRICVCSHRPFGRQKFTAAHEFGHHLLGHGTQIDAVVDLQTGSGDEERCADVFARYLLMPPRAVQSGFRTREIDPNSPAPLDVYRVSCWLGVGYSTLLQHMRYSLGLITDKNFKSLMRIAPKNLRSALVGITAKSDVWTLDAGWSGTTVHAQVGDLFSGIQVGSGWNSLLAELIPGVWIAEEIGDGQCRLTGGGTAKLRVSRPSYVGFYEYRYLPG